MKLRERLTPYLLLGVITLGTGLGIGLGLSEAPGASANTTGDRLHARGVTTATAHELIVGAYKGIFGIYKVTNAGHTWTNITPPFMDPIVVSHAVKIVSYGDDRIWLEMAGDARFDFIPYSWDGGVTWHIADLPGNANNPTSMRFLSPDDGSVTAYASSSNNSRASYQTTNAATNARHAET